jgi:hypothetical protein
MAWPSNRQRSAMHAGSINNPKSAAGRVYGVLKARPGQWIGGWELTQLSFTSAVSTRISEVRSQLPEIEVVETEQRKDGFFYRLVTVGSQLELAV